MILQCFQLSHSRGCDHNKISDTLSQVTKAIHAHQKMKLVKPINNLFKGAPVAFFQLDGFGVRKIPQLLWPQSRPKHCKRLQVTTRSNTVRLITISTQISTPKTKLLMSISNRSAGGNEDQNFWLMRGRRGKRGKRGKGVLPHEEFFAVRW